MTHPVAKPLLGEFCGVEDLISVIIPTYNRATLLIEVLKCLVNQIDVAIEVIVIDDGSTDDTLVRVRNWSQSHGVAVSVFSQANGGVSVARNHGLREARGEYVYFIDSDDYIFPNALKDMLSLLKKSGRPYCLASIQNANSELTPILTDSIIRPKISKLDVLSSGWLTHGALYRRSALDAAGRFNENLRGGEDAEYYWRIVCMNPPGEIIQATVGFRRIHDQGHLSFDRNDTERLHYLFGAYEAFIEWSLDNNTMTKQISYTAVRRVFVCLVELGARKDFKYFIRGQKTLKNLAKFQNFFAYFCSIIATPRMSYYYFVLSKSFSYARIVKMRLVTWN